MKGTKATVLVVPRKLPSQTCLLILLITGTLRLVFVLHLARRFRLVLLARHPIRPVRLVRLRCRLFRLRRVVVHHRAVYRRAVHLEYSLLQAVVLALIVRTAELNTIILMNTFAKNRVKTFMA